MDWFTSDNHFGHAGIIVHCKRPFASVEDMDREMIRRWNAVVAPGDRVFILGDFCWRTANYALPILDQLQGNLHLVIGNHDKGCLGSAAFKQRFAWTKDLYTLKVIDPDVGVRRIVLCHYAMRTWNQSHRGAWHLYGHSHGSLADDPNSLSLDVGADCHDFAPISYEQVKAKMARKRFVPLDHHRED